MDEATAFLSTLQATAPDAPTACAGWTAHDLVAHLTAGAAEMADLTERAATGQAPRATRDFATREAPFVAMADAELRHRLVLEAIRLGVAIDALAPDGPASTVAFSGRRLSAAELTMHGRSEAALHRWDMAGDDDISEELLAQPELTAHAVAVLNTMVDGSPEAVTARTTSTAITELRANFAAPGQLDVVLVIDTAGARLELDEPRTPFCATADPATRLLALWGRRSAPRRITWNEDGSTHPLATFLWGVGQPRPVSLTAPLTVSLTALSEIR
jgi:Mycothiol maleylpyruvate isomerase N-terminal domain